MRTPEEKKAAIAKSNNKYRQANKERIAEVRRKYNKENKARVAQTQYKYRQNRKTRLAEAKSEEEAKKAKKAESNKAYADKNRAQINKAANQKYRAKRFEITGINPAKVKDSKRQLEISRAEAERKRIQKIMAVPIKKESTQAYYMVLERRSIKSGLFTSPQDPGLNYA